MRKMKQTICLIISVIILMCGFSDYFELSEVHAATNERPTYTVAVSSYSELTSRLNALISKHKNTYWTTTGTATNSSGSASKYYYGIQCNGFAKYIFNELFCTGSIGSYDSNKYYFPNASGVNLIEKAWNISSGDTNTVKGILSRGEIGDFIQVRRRGETYGHSMILAGKDNNGIWIFDCNSDGKCGVKYYYQTWATFAAKNIGMSLYRSVKYPAITTTKPFQTCVDYPAENETYTGNVYMQGWALYGEGVSEVVCYVNDQPMCNCERYERTRVASTYPGYPTGNEGFKCTVDSSVFKEGANTVFFRAYTNNNTEILGDFGHRTIYYIPSTEAGEKTINDGEYRIVSALDMSKGLDIEGASTADGANVQLWSNTEDSTQTFYITYLDNGYYKIISKCSGKSLDVKDGNSEPGTNVWQYTWNGTSAQQWVIKPDSSGTWFHIVSKNNNLYLDAQNEQSQDGGNVHVYSETGSPAQKWRLIRCGDDVGKTVEDGEYHIVSALDNTKTVNVAGNSTDAGANIRLWETLDEPRQKFEVSYLGNGYYSIINTNSGLALSMKDGQAVNGTNVQQEKYTAGQRQKWILKSAGNGYYYIISQLSGLYLDVYNAETANGTNIHVWLGNETAAQKWKFVKNIGESIVTLSTSSYTYDGTAKKPSVTVKNGSTTLTQGTDYTVSYSSNVDVGTATVTVTGKGVYVGTITKTFSIKKANQSVSATISATTIDESATAQITASGQGTISYSSSNTAVATVDRNGVVTGKSEGTATITIKAGGNSNYNEGSKTITITVSKASISLTDVTVDLSAEMYTYDGEAKTPTVTVKQEDSILTEGTDYIVSYSNNVNAGTATITVTGTGDYAGTITKTYNIVRASQNINAVISTSAIKEGETAQITASGQGTISYSSSNAAVAAVDSSGVVTGKSEGTAIITVRADENSNYNEGSKTIAVIVSKSTINLSSAVIDMDTTSYIYDGTAKKPVMIVKVDNVTLTEGTDYVVSYSDNVNVGTATITLNGEGLYEGTKEKTFRIIKASQTVTANISASRIKVGETARITTDGYGTISYSSSSTDVATIDDYGVITGLSEGTATIFIEATGNDNYYSDFATVQITVVNEEEQKSDSMNDQASTDVENDAEIDAEMEEDEEPTAEISSTQLQQVGTKLVDSNGSVQYTVTSSDVSNPTVSFDGSTDENAGEITIPEYIENNGIEYEVTTVSIKSFEKKNTNAKYRVVDNRVDNLTVEYIGAMNKNSKTISIPKSVTYKGIKFKVTSIKAKALKNNKKVTNVKIADSIEKIGDSAFEGCTNLKTVTIGKELRTIGKNAFKDCKKLTKITIKSSNLKRVGKNALKDVNEECRIKVPKKKLKSYQRLFKGKGQKKSVQVTK